MEDRAVSCLIALRRVLSAADHNVRAVAKVTGLSVQQLIVLRIVEDTTEITPMMIVQVSRRPLRQPLSKNSRR